MARPTKQQRIRKAAHGSPLAVPPPPPADLTDAQRAEWQRVVALAEHARLTALDVSILRQYVVLSCKLAADPEGFTAALHTQLRLISAELGLTPASRAGLPEPKPDPADNPFAQFDRWSQIGR